MGSALAHQADVELYRTADDFGADALIVAVDGAALLGGEVHGGEAVNMVADRTVMAAVAALYHQVRGDKGALPCACHGGSDLIPRGAVGLADGAGVHALDAAQRYGVIADYMHLGGNNDDEKVQLLIKYLRNMNDELNIPHCIKHYGPDSFPTENGFVPENVFLERLPEIAKNAIADACTGSNPRQPSQEEMEKLLKCCYYDTEVDF